MLVLQTGYSMLVTLAVATCLVSASDKNCRVVDIATLRAIAKEQVSLLIFGFLADLFSNEKRNRDNIPASAALGFSIPVVKVLIGLASRPTLRYLASRKKTPKPSYLSRR